MIDIQALKAAAQKHVKEHRVSGRKSKLTTELIAATKKMRQAKFSFKAIYHGMTDMGIMPFKSYNTYYQTYRNKVSVKKKKTK